ncbi:MAG TPA: TIGR03790 family protein, partial [Opitutus sp.]|nr:TIGR03790 family protein [Opitutus sp.]
MTLVFVFGVWGRGAEELAARLVLLANGDDRDSVRVAQHYAAARGVPEENIIALPMSRAETISWTEFVATIWEPLQAELVKRKWIDAIAMNLTDEVGRTKYAMSGHRLSFLVVCRGVPLRVMHDPEHYVATPPYTNNAQFRTNAGAVDSELALLARPNYAVNAFVPNPLFSDDKPTTTETAQVIKVSRLDGPTLKSAMGLVDSAMTAERTGLLGRAYIDIGGQHASGDRWLDAVARMLADLHLDMDVNRARSTIPATARFDAPVLYFGWYDGRVSGPFTLPGFRFPPGAIAMHIHSYSAQTLRSAGQNWVGPFVAR